MYSSRDRCHHRSQGRQNANIVVHGINAIKVRILCFDEQGEGYLFHRLDESILQSRTTYQFSTFENPPTPIGSSRVLDISQMNEDVGKKRGGCEERDKDWKKLALTVMMIVMPPTLS